MKNSMRCGCAFWYIQYDVQVEWCVVVYIRTYVLTNIMLQRLIATASYSWVVLMSFHVANNCSVRRFDHKGHHQVQNCFVPDEDLCGRNVVRCSYLLRESWQTCSSQWELGHSWVLDKRNAWPQHLLLVLLPSVACSSLKLAVTKKQL